MSEEFIDAVMTEESEAMPAEESESVPAEDSEKEVDKEKTLEEPDASLIGAKVAKAFNGMPYIGEITGARTTEEGPLYKVLYRDNDREEFTATEAQIYQQDYTNLQAEMWNCMVTLVEDLNVDTLIDAGIKTISDLELFGGTANGGAAASGTPFDSLDMPLKTKQQLYIIATYLLNDQILSKDSKLDDMARFNLAKANGTLQKPRQARASNATATASVKKSRGRPKRAAVGTTAKKPRGRPKKTTSTTATGAKKKSAPLGGAGGEVKYSGSPKDSIEEVTD